MEVPLSVSVVTALQLQLPSIISTYFTTAPLLIIYGKKAQPHILDILVKGAISVNRSVVIYNDDTKFTKGKNLFVQKPSDIVLYNADPRKSEENAFYVARSKILWLGEEEKDVFVNLERVWDVGRSRHVAGATLPDLTLYKRAPKRTKGAKECNKWVVKPLGAMSAQSLTLLSAPIDIKATLKECPLYEVTSAVPPLVSSDPDKFGIETELLQTIAKKLEMVVVKRRLPVNESIYMPSWDGHLTGCVRLLATHKADVCFGGIHSTWHPWHLVDLPQSHHESLLVWHGPAPRPLSRIHTIYLGFSPQVWAAVSLATTSFIVFSGVYELQRRAGRSVGAVTMHLLSATLNSASPAPPTWLARVLLVLYYVYSLHITSVYQSVLTSFQSKTPTEKPINTLDEALDAHLKFVVINGHANYIMDSELAVMRRLVKEGNFQIAENTDIYVREGGMSDKNVFLGERLSVLIMNRMLGVPHNLLVPPFSSSPINLLLSPGSALTPLIDDLVLRIVASGFLAKWVRDGTPKPKPTLLVEKKALTLESFEGAFYILGTAVSGASVALAAEIAVAYIHRRQIAQKASGDDSLKKRNPSRLTRRFN